MKKSLLLFLLGTGLVLVTAGTVFARGNNLYLPSGAAARTFNAGTGFGGPAGPVAPSNGYGSGTYSAAVAGNQAHDGATRATCSAGSATLAGAFILLLLQRRYRNDRGLRPRL